MLSCSEIVIDPPRFAMLLHGAALRQAQGERNYCTSLWPTLILNNLGDEASRGTQKRETSKEDSDNDHPTITLP